MVVPGATPLIMPDPGLITATAVLLLVHTPPVLLSLKFVVDPLQTLSIPLITAGKGLTVILVYSEQPVPPTV